MLACDDWLSSNLSLMKYCFKSMNQCWALIHLQSTVRVMLNWLWSESCRGAGGLLQWAAVGQMHFHFKMLSVPAIVLAPLLHTPARFLVVSSLTSHLTSFLSPLWGHLILHSACSRIPLSLNWHPTCWKKRMTKTSLFFLSTEHHGKKTTLKLLVVLLFRCVSSVLYPSYHISKPSLVFLYKKKKE